MSRRIPLIDGDLDTNTLHPERISLAYQILSGIPEKHINLDRFYPENQSADEPLCGTIACGAGWLALHPDFQAMGLEVRSDWGFRDGIRFVFSRTQLGGFSSLAKVLVVGEQTLGINLVYNIFNSYRDGDWDYQLLCFLRAGRTLVVPHRKLLLARLRYAYQHHCGLAGQ